MDRKTLRRPAALFLVVGIALLVVGAISRQIAYLPMGTALIGGGLVFLAAAQRRRR
ncbi:hypothetical protein [Cognatilysobacter lacus]|uniref:hypothetical protein n=1 Tax=Cognatilysobacter lacus TaxID=1643323 RepID=UPI001659148E|nr:hypothetical protein [Lysobacter lacus]